MTRLTQDKFTAFKTTFAIWKKVVKTDDYGAQTTDHTKAGEFVAMFTPVSDEASIEEYGEAVKDLLKAVVYNDPCGISAFDQIIIHGDWYEVIKVETWNTHKLITVKRLTNQGA